MNDYNILQQQKIIVVLWTMHLRKQCSTQERIVIYCFILYKWQQLLHEYNSPPTVRSIVFCWTIGKFLNCNNRSRIRTQWPDKPMDSGVILYFIFISNLRMSRRCSLYSHILKQCVTWCDREREREYVQVRMSARAHFTSNRWKDRRSKSVRKDKKMI